MSKFQVVPRHGWLRIVIAPLLLLLMVLGQPAGMASAAPSTPTDLAPNGTTVSAIPTLSWTRAAGASTYTVEVSASSSFSPVLWTSNTVNRYAVPTTQLPPGTVYWRVRGVNGSLIGTWADSSFVRSAIAGPTGLSPASATVFSQPTQPPVISWTQLSGAVSYTVQVSGDPAFANTAVTHSYTTKGTSLVVSSLIPGQAYYWRVRASMPTSVLSDWSESRNFGVGNLAKPTLVGPANGSPTKVEDVVLDWAPVVGATSYDMQLSTSSTFGSLVLDVKNITGTAYSPPSGLTNGVYYWRVRPIDAQGLHLAWTSVDTWSFTRGWTVQPTLEYPISGATVGDPLYYQWTAVKLGDQYTLQLSTSSDFSSDHIVDTCNTVHTTYTPSGITDCYPDADGTYYWRVFATDTPGRIGSEVNIVTDLAAAQVGSFTYKNVKPTLLSPATGTSLSVPVLKWSGVNGAAKYKVTITPVTSGDLGGGAVFTTATSFTPRIPLTVGSTYKWMVQTVSASGRIGSETLLADQPTFTVTAQATPVAVTPEPTGTAPSSARFPTLTWTPVVGANNYTVLVRANGTTTWFPLDPSFVYPAGEDDGTDWLDPGTYQWKVQAYQASTLLSTSIATSTFTITGLSAVSGQRVAMTGAGTGSSTTWCALAQPSSCNNLRQTPVLAWNSDADTAFYRVYLAKDAALTLPLAGYPKTVESTRLSPTVALPDNASGGAYYWFVQPCRANGICGAMGNATNAFVRVSKPVQLLTPTAGGTGANEITFTWRDYLATNQDATAFPVSDSTGVQTVAARIEARQYRLQVSTSSSFATTLDNVLVDQQTFTSFTTTYPEGTLYWRVQAVDGSANPLTWSAVQSFTKTSPKVVPISPRNAVSVPGYTQFTWNPLAYAASYDIEIYKNADTTATSTNRVVLAHTKLAAYSPPTPLATSDTAYVWRVRAVDVKGRVSPWTSLNGTGAQVFITGSSPSLVAPTGGSYVPSKEALFSWSPVAGATSYRIERRIVGSLAVQSSVTPATSWASSSAIATGDYQWRVSSLDASGRIIASSFWRGFKVDATAPKVTSYGPGGLVAKGTDFTVTFSEPVIGVDDTTFTIKPYGDTVALPATVTMNGAGTVATLNPSAALTVGAKYTLKVGSSVTDVHDNHLANLVWTVTAK